MYCINASTTVDSILGLELSSWEFLVGMAMEMEDDEGRRGVFGERRLVLVEEWLPWSLLFERFV